jgi:outer membrane biosynthesis protein TonB
MNYGKIDAWHPYRSGSAVETPSMSAPHKPARTGTRADRMLVRAIFLMLALLLHIQTIRFFSPRFAETSTVEKAPLVVHLKAAPQATAAPVAPPIASEAPVVKAHEALMAPSAAQSRLPAAAMPTAIPAAPSVEPEPYYHSPHALTRPPELVEEAPAEIELPELQEPGQVLLRLSIDRYGVVNGVQVLRSSLTRELEGQVVLQFYRARYRPGEIDGLPVNSELLLVVNLQ